MNILKKIGEWVKKLLGINDIKSVIKSNIAISSDMVAKIEAWYNAYSGKASWVKGRIKSLRLEQSIVREFANISLNEMTASVSNEKLDTIFKDAIKDINYNFQLGLATGAMVIKPLGDNRVQFLSQNSFIPLEYDSRGRLTKVIFPDVKQEGNNDYYTRLEIHTIDYVKGLTIENRAFHSKNKSELGREISLDLVSEWANLEKSITYPKMAKPAFGYYRNPIANTIDGSFVGVSVFENALDLVQKADVQFGRLDWEFESGERALFVDEGALKKDEHGNILPQYQNRLYRGLDIEQGNGNGLFEEFTPQLRQSELIAGLDEYKRNIEFAVGLSYGDLSNPQNVDKTATEIKSAKQRKYNTVTAIQNALKDCLEDLVYALAFFNSMATQKYEFVCDFKDSILTDEAQEREQDEKDLANGTLRLEEYRAKWRGEDLDTALKNLPDTSQVIE